MGLELLAIAKILDVEILSRNFSETRKACVEYQIFEVLQHTTRSEVSLKVTTVREMIVSTRNMSSCDGRQTYSIQTTILTDQPKIKDDDSVETVRITAKCEGFHR